MWFICRNTTDSRRESNAVGLIPIDHLSNKTLRPSDFGLYFHYIIFFCFVTSNVTNVYFVELKLNIGRLHCFDQDFILFLLVQKL